MAKIKEIIDKAYLGYSSLTGNWFISYPDTKAERDMGNSVRVAKEKSEPIDSHVLQDIMLTQILDEDLHLVSDIETGKHKGVKRTFTSPTNPNKGFEISIQPLEQNRKQNNPVPKPYSDPSMKEVLEEEFGGSWKLRDCFWTGDTPIKGFTLEPQFTCNGLSAIMPSNFQAILATHGYFIDCMFEIESDGNYHFKF